MGRHWAIIFPEGGPVPPNTLAEGRIFRPSKREDGMMEFTAASFRYSRAANIAYRILVAAGYSFGDKLVVIVADAARAQRYPDLHLFGRFLQDEHSSMTWPPEECIKIARDMHRLFADTLEDAPEMAPYVPEEYDNYEPPVPRELLEEAFDWGETVLSVFEEAVFRNGSVNTG